MYDRTHAKALKDLGGAATAQFFWVGVPYRSLTTSHVGEYTDVTYSDWWAAKCDCHLCRRLLLLYRTFMFSVGGPTAVCAASKGHADETYTDYGLRVMIVKFTADCYGFLLLQHECWQLASKQSVL